MYEGHGGDVKWKGGEKYYISWDESVDARTLKQHVWLIGKTDVLLGLVDGPTELTEMSW